MYSLTKAFFRKIYISGIVLLAINFSNTHAQTVAGGGAHTMLICTDSTLWGGGYNYHGQLGNGDCCSFSADKSVPVQVPGLTDITAIALGENYTLAVQSNGTLWAWGENTGGQLGNGTKTNSTSPVQITGIANVISVAAGEYHSVALKNDGTVWTWGVNDRGQLGDGTTDTSLVPIQVSGISGIIDIAAGNQHTLALKSDGTVWAWGWNFYGQLGNGTTTDQYTPVQVSGISTGAAIAANGLQSFVLKSDGTVWAWGWNLYGQLGDGTTTNQSTPVQTLGLSNILEIAAGENHTMALKNDSTVWSWGRNNNGQLGDGTANNASQPVQVSNLSDIINIGSGEYHSLATSDTAIWAWGRNTKGQLGNGSTTDSPSPVQMNFSCSAGTDTLITIAEARNRGAGVNVTVRGIVTSGPNEFYRLRFLQDGTAGIAAYGTEVDTLERGDSVEISGTLKDYNGLLEISPVSGVTIITSGNSLPSPAMPGFGSAFAEQYEGMLVRVNNVTFSSPATDTFQTSSNYDITDGIITNTISTYSNSFNSTLFDKLIPADTVDLVGVMGEYNGTYQLLLRDSFDVLIKTAGDTTDTTNIINIRPNNINIFPNPVKSVLNITSELDKGSFKIFNILGQEILNGDLTKANTVITLTQLPRGIYFLEINADGTVIRVEKIIKE